MSELHPQARELNQVITGINPQVLAMLSARGRAIYFPSKGILAQSGEAKGKKINATIGIALEDDGKPLALACISKRLQLTADEAFNYAPSPGNPDLRAVWRKMMYDKNPSLAGKEVSQPVVTCALTHGLSMAGYLFADPGDRVITPDLYWENCELIFSNAYGANLHSFTAFTDGGFNLTGLRQALLDGPVGKRIVMLNFPNNPAGYTPTAAEAVGIRQALLAAAEAGNQVVVLIDDAYFGLVYEPGVITESIFPALADLHANLLAVKIDGATKEDYVWGFRVGFMTYAIKGGTKELYAALEAKTAGAVRGNISNAPRLSQALLTAAYQDPDYAAQKQEKFLTLKRRYNKVKAILAAHPEYAQVMTPVPFNSGYFMCLRLAAGIAPEQVRQVLLKEYSTGVIVASGVIRVAFSATPFGLLEELYSNLYQAALKVRG